jgi:hypothetical protein
MPGARSFPWPLTDGQYNAGRRQPLIILDTRIAPGGDPGATPGLAGPMTVGDWESVISWLEGLPPGTLPPLVAIRSDVTLGPYGGGVPVGTVDMRGGWFIGPFDPGSVFPDALPTLTLEGVKLSNVGGFRSLNVNVNGPTDQPFFGSVIDVTPLSGELETCTLDNVQIRVANDAVLFAVYGGGPNILQLFLNNSSCRQGIEPADSTGRLVYVENLGTVFVIATGLGELDADTLRADAATQGGIAVRATSSIGIGAQPRAPVTSTPFFEQLDRFEAAAPGVAVPCFQQLGANPAPDGNLWISQAWVVNLGVQPEAGDTLTLRDDLNNVEELYTFVVGPANPGEITIGGNPQESARQICSAIDTQSALWGAADAVLPYNLPGGAANVWCVIYRRTQEVAAYDDLIRASFTNAPGLQVIDLSDTWKQGTYAQSQGEISNPVTVQADDTRRLFGWGLPFVRPGTLVSLLDNTPTVDLVGRVDQPSPGVIYNALPAFNFVDDGVWSPSSFYAIGLNGDWQQPAPTTYKDALDRLASAVAGLIGGQIPLLP